MSKYRKRAGRTAKRSFSRTASRVHPKNAGSIMRGGIRL